MQIKPEALCQVAEQYSRFAGQVTEMTAQLTQKTSWLRSSFPSKDLGNPIGELNNLFDQWLIQTQKNNQLLELIAARLTVEADRLLKLEEANGEQ